MRARDHLPRAAIVRRIAAPPYQSGEGKGDGATEVAMKSYFAIVSSLLLLACSDPPSITVNCNRAAQADGTTVDCSGDEVSGGSAAGNGTITAGAPEQQPVDSRCVMEPPECPYAFPLDKRVELCSLNYLCPTDDPTNPTGFVCVRFMMLDCFATHAPVCGP